MIDITTYMAEIGFYAPEDVGESEYRAIYDCIHDGLHGVEEDELLDHTLAMLKQFEDIAGQEIKRLKSARESGYEVN